jgi:protease-4
VSKSKNRAVFGVLFLVFLFFIILMIFATYTMQVLQDESSGIDALRSKGKIGVVEIEGVIMNSKKTVELLQKAEKDKSIEAIIVRINSPGGAVGPAQEIYEEIRRIDSAYDQKPDDEKDSDDKKKGKPVYASFGTVAASGGYYVGAAARRIYSNPGTMTGSIGVIMEFMDLSKLYDWAKVRQETIKAGRYKDVGHPNRGMTQEEKDLLGGMITGVHSQFREHILALRKKKLKKDIDELAQGQIFSGQQAKDFGLVDRIGSLWTAAREVHEELKLEGEMTIKYVRKKKKASVWDFVDSMEEAANHLNFQAMFNKVPLLMAKLRYE